MVVKKVGEICDVWSSACCVPCTYCNLFCVVHAFTRGKTSLKLLHRRVFFSFLSGETTAVSGLDSHMIPLCTVARCWSCVMPYLLACKAARDPPGRGDRKS